MKIKCYAIAEEGRETITEYADPSQKSFLDYELKQEIKKILTGTKGGSVSFEKTSNGVWYRRVFNFDSDSAQGHLVLISQDAANMTFATSLLTKGNQFRVKNQAPDKIRMKLGEMIRMCNANSSKFQQINNNVTELQGIMKNSVTKIVDNLSDLGQVERKSEMMSSLSMQLQQDSRALQRKMRKRKLIMRLVIAGLIAFVVLIVIYMVFW